MPRRVRMFCLEADKGEAHEGTGFLDECVRNCGFKIERINRIAEPDQEALVRFNACAEILDTARIFQVGWLAVLDLKVKQTVGRKRKCRYE